MPLIVFDPCGGQWVGGRYVPSLLAAIGGVVEQHMIDIGLIPAPEGHGKPRAEKQLQVVGETSPNARFRSCPKCGSPTLIRQEVCDTCTSCGYSKYS
jgi:ribonucleoside-diphosphate reductase alpha chain